MPITTTQPVPGTVLDHLETHLHTLESAITDVRLAADDAEHLAMTEGRERLLELAETGQGAYKAAISALEGAQLLKDQRQRHAPFPAEVMNTILGHRIPVPYIDADRVGHSVDMYENISHLLTRIQAQISVLGCCAAVRRS